MEHVSEAPGAWRCVAGSAHRSYAVEHLDRHHPQFQLAVYNSPQINPQHLLEIIPIQVLRHNSQGILGSGTTQTGQTITVKAFQKTVDFVVDDPETGLASGVCSYLSDSQ